MIFEDWGLIEYKRALNQQLRIVRAVHEAKENFSFQERLIFCSHHPVVTLGRATQEEEVKDWKGPTIEVSRGGRATFHGPSQIMVYSILSLKSFRRFLKAKDIFSYLRLLETVFIQVLKEFHLKAKPYPESEFKVKKFVFKENQNKGPKDPEVGLNQRAFHRPGKDAASFTGIWVGNKKVISIGVAFKNWISYHGASIHFDRDEKAFYGIKPCGFLPQTMTSLEEVLGQKLNRSFFKEKLKSVFFDLFQ